MATPPAEASLKIALAQLNPVVGDLEGNVERAVVAAKQAAADGADLVVFSELFITGYPPEDLVLKPAFQAAAKAATERLAVQLKNGPGVLVGTICCDGDNLYNAVALLDDGKVQTVRFKVALPNYGVFDEKRVFAKGPMPGPIPFRGVKIGVPICEDIWRDDITECLEETGAELLIVPNGSPFDWKKPDARLNVVLARVTETGLPLAYVNQVGGQDELVFDGASFVVNSDHDMAVQLPAWSPAVVTTAWSKTTSDKTGEVTWRCQTQPLAQPPEGDAAAYHACVLGVRDYVHKNGFPSVVLGLSGGIDSALVAAIATDALGADKVHAVMLPYRYTSKDSVKDAAETAQNLGLRYDTVDIAESVAGVSASIKDLFAGTDQGVTEENIQSRLRGVILMAISNKFGAMLLTTGNKSEMSVGYATLYGDMNGGFNPIKDLYKTEVYRLARWRNANRPDGALGPSGPVIPENILTKAPTAELRENQTDQDSLPPYDSLDQILVGLVEEERSVSEIAATGIDRETVKNIEHLLYLSEYKRRQAAPGVKISARSFGRDRRYPITNKYREDGA